MTPMLSARADVRFPMPYLAPFLIALLLAITAVTARADGLSEPQAGLQVARDDFGVATALIAPNATVHTPDGRGAGQAGAAAYIASLHERFPEATFATSGSQVVGNLLIVDWQGVEDGRVVAPGRTLIRFENGVIAEIHFLNLNDVAPANGAPARQPAVSVTYELPYEQGRPVVIEAEIAAEEPASATGPAPARFATDADQDPR